ncbi:MAG: PIN domain-containing protein [Verrucomicrobia bacterium]|nr:PIN domain-containing protein [Verrucomicrobiota bacterium]
MKWFLDTNVPVAACVAEHEHHARALPLVESVHQAKAEGFISAHSLLETYSILTRLPRSPRISPSQAATLVQENVINHFTVVALTAKEYGELAARLGRNSIIGGQAYDALHLECAEKCGAEQIYTFNVRHFAGLAAHLSEKIVAP